MSGLDTIDYGSAPDQSLQAVDGENNPYIYTSIRFDPILKGSPENTAASFNIPCPFYMLEHHWTRLQVANWSAQFWPQGISRKAHERPADFLRGLLYAVRQWQKMHPKEAEWAEALRIRRRSYPCGRVTTEIWQIPRKPLSDFFPTTFDLSKDVPKTDWTVILDNQATLATEATMFKIWDRSPQGRARADAGILSLATTKEVLLYNPDNEILDGSNSTPYFYRKGRWVTPISSCGGLQGTTRRWALEKGLCTEAVISTDSFTDGEVIWFSNAVKGFFWAIYHERDPDLQPPSAAQSRHVLEQLS